MRRRAFPIAGALGVAFLTAASVVVVASPAQAADLPAIDCGAPAPRVLALAADSTIVGGAISVACDVTIDLAGHALAGQSITIASSATLTIADTSPVDPGTGLRAGRLTLVSTTVGQAAIRSNAGTLILDADATVASGAAGAAGIGGNALETGGRIEIRGDATVATGGSSADGGGAGIGGGAGGDGGVIQVLGDDTRASGGEDAAGIGGGATVFERGGDFRVWRGNGGTITVGGDRTVARGNTYGAGIGGGSFAHSGTVRVTGDSTLASSMLDAATPGAGAGIGGGYCGVALDVTVSGTDTEAVSGSGAGIGAGAGTDPFGFVTDCTLSAGAIVVSGDRTSAHSSFGAGIGGGLATSAASIIVSGDDVDARSTAFSAGIGSGRGFGVDRAAVGRILISGQRVDAVGGAGAPGIGAARGSDPGVIEIAMGASVSATSTGNHATPDVSAIGGAETFGALVVDGILRLESGRVVVADDHPTEPEIVVGASGQIVGSIADPTLGASFSGAGQLHNGGTITLATASVTGGAPALSVTGNHSRVQFPGTGEVTVFAPTMASGARSIPSGMPTPPSGHLFVGWQTSPGVGFAATSLLPGTSTGSPVLVPLIAASEAAAIDPLSFDVVAGAAESASLRLRLSSGGDVAVPASGWTFAAPADVTASIGGAPALLTVGSETAGARTIDVTATVAQGVIATTAMLLVRPAPVHALDVRLFTWTGTEARVGDTLTLLADGYDAYGNTHGDVTADSTITSDQAGDVIVGNTVRFTHASPHILTVEHGPSAVRASIVIEVHAVPAAEAAAASRATMLGRTGADGVDANASLVVLLLVAGLGLLCARRAFARRARV